MGQTPAAARWLSGPTVVPRGAVGWWAGAGPSDIPLPSTDSGAGHWCVGWRGWAVLGALGLLAGAGVSSWLLGQFWDFQWLGEGQRTDSGGARREEQVVSRCLGQVG